MVHSPLGPHEPQSCRVCMDIMDLSRIVHDSDGRSDPSKRALGSISEVTAMPCPHAKSIQELWNSEKPTDLGLFGEWNVEIRYLFDDFALRFYNKNQPETDSFYRTFNLITRPDRAGHTGVSRVIGTDWTDPSIFRSWYATCLKQHGIACEEPLWMEAQPGTIAKPEWLIDVKRWCLVPYSNDTTTYLTLSYTWGKADCLQTTTAILEQLTKPMALRATPEGSIPRTVRDAIKITKLLGESYLWVDSLCIIQDDATSLHNNLNNMHQIYARSTLCLVAFSGLDANHGLRGIDGISEPRCIDQSVLPIADGEAISWFNKPRATWDQFEQVLEAEHTGLTYDERGWTYQEFMFAKRRLIFTDGPLRWICPCAIWGEDKLRGLTIDNMMNMPFTKWKDRQRPGLAGLLTDLASGFAARHFTYDKDTLSAFLGIQNHLHRIFLGGLNYGHPDMFFDISLIWEPDAEMRRRSFTGNAFLDTGYLPSWSWMGWQGDFHFLCDDEYECYGAGPDMDGVVEPVTEWYAMQSPSTLPSCRRPIQCNWHRYKILARADFNLVPKGWIRHRAPQWEGEYEIGDARFRYPVPVPSLERPIEPTEQWKYIFAKTTRAYFVVRKINSGSQLRDAEFCVELCTATGELAGFLRLHQKSDKDILIANHQIELVAVVKGWTTEFSTLAPGIKRYEEDGTYKKYPCYFVLCIWWENGVAKRQASGKVFADAWERHQEPVNLIMG